MGPRTRLPVKVDSVGFLYISAQICARGLFFPCSISYANQSFNVSLR